jgi:molybdate transport system substrate-binding protein
MSWRVAAGAFLLLWLGSVSSPAASDSAHAELTLYAAASLRDALEAILPECGKATSTLLVPNLGASSDLARQIQAANKADIFFSADEAWMDKLAASGLVDPASRRSPLSNRLVVVAPADSSLAVSSAADLVNGSIRRLSLANPEAVPAGKYAKAWLEKAGVWDRVKERVLPGIDVRAALAAVESGGAEAGIVYRTDARISSRVRVLFEVPEGDGPPISYSIAAMKDRPHLEAAREVVACISGREAAKTFERLGFVVTMRL